MRRSLSTVLAVAILAASPAAYADDTMKTLMQTLDRALNGKSAPQVQASLVVVALVAPKDFPEWEAIATKGVEAAKRRDLAGASASCQGCHEKYRDAFKAKYGSGSGKPTPAPDPRE